MSVIKSNNAPILSVKHKRKVLGYSLALAVTLIIISLLISIFYVRSNKIELAQQSLHNLSSVQDEFENIYSKIGNKNIKGIECDDSHLLQLRDLIFESLHIKDIGYVSNGMLICNTSLGKLASPYKFREPDIIDVNNNKFWLHEDLKTFGSKKIAFLTQTGNYILTINPTLFNLDELSPTKFETIHLEPKGTFHLAGTRGMYDSYNERSAFANLFNFNTIKLCENDNSFCVVASISTMLFLPSSATSIFIIALSTVLLACLFHHLLIQHFINLNSPIARVKRGLKNNRFYVLYQPLVETNSGKLVGCEVLARFKDEHGDLYPDQFIPLIRQLEQTWVFTIQVIIDGIDGLENLTNLPEQFGVNFNLFPLDVNTNAISNLKLIKQLNTTQLNITFEITEEEYTDKASSKKNLDIIKASGFRLALDDFGTGYSNLEQFRELGFDVIKIDRSFINNIENTNESLVLARHLISFAHEFNLTVVAEGVENEAQHEILKDLGVHYCQGWLFGKPMTQEQMQSLINTQKI